MFARALTISRLITRTRTRQVAFAALLMIAGLSIITLLLTGPIVHKFPLEMLVKGRVQNYYNLACFNEEILEFTPLTLSWKDNLGQLHTTTNFDFRFGGISSTTDCYFGPEPRPPIAPLLPEDNFGTDALTWEIPANGTAISAHFEIKFGRTYKLPGIPWALSPTRHEVYQSPWLHKPAPDKPPAKPQLNTWVTKFPRTLSVSHEK